MKEYLLIDTDENRCYSCSIRKDDERLEYMKEMYSHGAQIFEFDDDPQDPHHLLYLTYLQQGCFAECIDRLDCEYACKQYLLDNMNTLLKCHENCTNIEKLIVGAYKLGYVAGVHHATVTEEEEEEEC